MCYQEISRLIKSNNNSNEMKILKEKDNNSKNAVNQKDVDLRKFKSNDKKQKYENKVSLNESINKNKDREDKSLEIAL